MKKAMILIISFLFASCASNPKVINNATNFNSNVINEGNSTSESVDKTNSKYVKPKISDGLYYGDNLFENGNAALVISFENKPIPPKSNEPNSQTIPGFYPQGEKRFPFLEIKVIRNQVYFKTDSIDGLRFEFKGVTGKEFDRELNTYVPFRTYAVERYLIKIKNESTKSN